MFIKTGKTDENVLACTSSLRQYDNFFFSLLQLERAEVRLEGIDTILKLAAKNFLLPSVQYAMFCGWQRLIPEGANIG